MSFVLLAGDSLEIVHVGSADRRADDLELLNHRGVGILLVVLNEDQNGLHVLKFDVLECDRRTVRDLVLGEHDVLNRFSRADLIEIQRLWLIDKYSDIFCSLVSRTLYCDRM